MYRFHQFHIPTHPPFGGNPGERWLNFIGEFLAPIVQGEIGILFWFCNHDGAAQPNYQFAFISSDYQRIEAKIVAQQTRFNVLSQVLPTNGARIEFAGSSRFLGASQLGNTSFEDRRAMHVLRLLHAASALLIHQLEKNGNQWQIEPNTDTTQNPLGNSFESILHLIANLSTAKFRVTVTCQTDWMSQPMGVQFPCQL